MTPQILCPEISDKCSRSVQTKLLGEEKKRLYVKKPSLTVAVTPLCSGSIPLRETSFKYRPSMIYLNIQGQVNSGVKIYICILK